MNNSLEQSSPQGAQKTLMPKVSAGEQSLMQNYQAQDVSLGNPKTL